MIGIVTALVGDLASLLGCVAGHHFFMTVLTVVLFFFPLGLGLILKKAATLWEISKTLPFPVITWINNAIPQIQHHL